MPSVVHAFLHLPEYIRACGPLHYYWTFVMERYVGRLTRLATSRLHPYSSLIKNLVIQEQIRGCRTRYSRIDAALQHGRPRQQPHQPIADADIFLHSPKSVTLSGSEFNSLVFHLTFLYPALPRETIKSSLRSSGVTAWQRVSFDEGRDKLVAAEGPGRSGLGAKNRDATWVAVSSFLLTSVRQ